MFTVTVQLLRDVFWFLKKRDMTKKACWVGAVDAVTAVLTSEAYEHNSEPDGGFDHGLEVGIMASSHCPVSSTSVL